MSSNPEIDSEKPSPSLLTIHQLCGKFNKDRRAIEKMGIPRVVLGPNDYRWNPKDVDEWIASRTEKQK